MGYSLLLTPKMSPHPVQFLFEKLINLIGILCFNVKNFSLQFYFVCKPHSVLLKFVHLPSLESPDEETCDVQGMQPILGY